MKGRAGLLVAVNVAVLAFLCAQPLRSSGLMSEPLTALRYIGRGALVRLPRTPTPFVRRIDTFDYRGTTGNYIDDNVYIFGAFERPELHLLRDLLVSRSGKDGVFLDIGANVGQHALFVAAHARTVHAIEPFPPVLARMDEMIAANGIQNVVVHRVGYSNEAGSLPFFAPSDSNLGTGSFDGSFSTANHKIADLPLVIGDEDLAQTGVPRIDLVKIDIEGFERYALLGLRQTLERDRPAVLLELNAVEGGFSTQAELDQTFPANYRYYEVTAPGGGEDEFAIAAWSVMYVYGSGIVGDYEIVPFTGDFAQQRNVLAIAAEQALP